jgi:hypothetical protein
MTPDSNPREIAQKVVERHERLTVLWDAGLDADAYEENVELHELLYDHGPAMARALVAIDPDVLRAAATKMEMSVPRFGATATELRRYAAILDGGSTAEEQPS